MMLFAYLLVMGATALIIQKCFDPPGWMGGADWTLTPLVVVYATIFFGRGGAWVFAVFLGLMTDLLSEAKIGTGSFCLLAMAVLLQTQKTEAARTRWYLQIFFALVGTMFFLILDYSAFCIHQRRWIWATGWGVYQLMTIAAVVNAAIAPVVYMGFNRLFRSLGCDLHWEKEVGHDP